MAILNGLRRQLAEQSIEELLACEDDAVLDYAEETLISDVRSGMRPMQIIESKFGVALSRDSRLQDWNSRTSTTRFA